jgi:hypothetical protein
MHLLVNVPSCFRKEERTSLAQEPKCSSSLCKQSPYRSCLPNENSVPNIQKPSETGLRIQGGGDFETYGAVVAISTRAAGEESSSIRAIAARRQMTARANLFLRQLALSELHVNAAASGVDSDALLRGRNADYHTGLI